MCRQSNCSLPGIVSPRVNRVAVVSANFWLIACLNIVISCLCLFQRSAWKSVRVFCISCLNSNWSLVTDDSSWTTITWLGFQLQLFSFFLSPCSSIPERSRSGCFTGCEVFSSSWKPFCLLFALFLVILTKPCL